MLFRKSYFFIVFIFNLSLVSFHFLKNLNFSGTTNYSLSYYRMIELEVRLLEKEWSGEANIFAQARLR
ncbi:hypothetical protein C5473_07295 [Leptospira interrogans serovar Weerasinghe]|nr:hypothetical protein C5473_07295 [Leptospira interrogans serovar Weerasinghe]